MFATMLAGFGLCLILYSARREDLSFGSTAIVISASYLVGVLVTLAVVL